MRSNSAGAADNRGSCSVFLRRFAAFAAVNALLFQLRSSTTAIEPRWRTASGGFDPQTVDARRDGDSRTNENTASNEGDSAALGGSRGAPASADPDASTGTTADGTDPPSTGRGGPRRRPLNVVVLYPDDWRHDTIGGVAPVVKTPFLNRLAGEGVRFTHNMVTTSICWVSRATLFTGQYCSRHRSYRLRTPEFYRTWNSTGWPALLQRLGGYYTGHVGKWQYANPKNIVKNQLFNFTKLFEGRHQYKHNGRTISAAEKTFLAVREFLDARPKDRPFAVTAAFYPPKAIGNSYVPGGQWFPQNITREIHYENETIPRPYNETDSHARLPWFFRALERGGRSRWEERFQGEERFQAAMKNYYSLVTEVDEACQKIYQELEGRGILDDTMIVFTTDNGLFHAEHGLAGKWYPYQESIRVPLIVRDPRMPAWKRNTMDGSLTLNIDLHPTILGAAGIVPPPQTQGRDIADLYLPRSRNDDDIDHVGPERDAAPVEDFETPPSSMALSSGVPWREEFFYEFPLDMGKTMPMSTAVVRKDLKYIYWPQFKYEQLFNLTEDPLELMDVWGEERYAQVLKELRARHSKMIEQVK